MGLVSAGIALGARLLGIGGGTVARTAPSLISRVGGALTGAFGQGLAGGAVGAGAVGFFGGDEPDQLTQTMGVLGQVRASGGQVTRLANGQFMAIAPNGDMQIFNRNGEPRRPSMIIPAGQRLPGGSIVVATRNNGAQIGIVKRRRRRAFGTEIRRVRRTVQAANALVNLCKPAKRRA